MSPYAIPAKAVSPYVSDNLMRALNQVEVKTLADILCSSVEDIRTTRNTGKMVFEEFNQLRRSIIEDVEPFLQVAAQRQLIDLRTIRQPDPKSTSAFLILRESFKHLIPRPLRKFLDDRFVLTLQDVLLLDYAAPANHHVFVQYIIASLKSELLIDIQQRILDRRNEGMNSEETLTDSERYRKLISSHILIESVDLPTLHKVRPFLDNMEAVTLYEVLAIRNFGGTSKHVWTPTVFNDFMQFEKEINEYLGEGTWLSLDFFDRPTTPSREMIG